jgi:uncharacterized protein YndB with AHSA1/START domain
MSSRASTDRIEKVVHLDVPRSRVWRALTDVEKQYLLNTNENATVSISQKNLELNKTRYRTEAIARA